jgi:hypothetical protein
MATDDPIRASDSDREVVVAALREAYTAGRLTLDEFDERMSAAYASKTWGDLRVLTVDLPSQPILGGDVPGRLFRGALTEPPAPLKLPAHPHRATVTPPPRRRSPLPILIPIAVWTILAVHAGGAGTGFVVLSMVLLAMLFSAFRRR